MNRVIRLLPTGRGARVAVLAGALIGVCLCPALCFAQRGRGGGGFEQGRVRGPVQMDEQTVVDITTEILHLTDAQKQQVQTIFDAAVQTAVPIVAETQGSENTLFDAVKAGKSEDEIKRMASQQGSLRGQLLLLQAQTFSKLWALLTADQRSEAGILIYNGIGQFLDAAHPPAPLNVPSAASGSPISPAPAPTAGPAGNPTKP